MSCKFNSELLVAAFWTDHPKGIPPPPLRFWIPIPQEGNRPRAPIPPGTKCWFAGFIFCFERPKALSDYDLNADEFFSKNFFFAIPLVQAINQMLSIFMQSIHKCKCRETKMHR